MRQNSALVAAFPLAIAQNQLLINEFLSFFFQGLSAVGFVKGVDEVVLAVVEFFVLPSAA